VCSVWQPVHWLSEVYFHLFDYIYIYIYMDKKNDLESLLKDILRLRKKIHELKSKLE